MTDRRTKGLYGKFIVFRTDGTDAPGEKHDGCTYFVLDLQHDKHMPPALRAYADSCEQDYPVLARQLRIVADDFGKRGEFIGIMAQKPALDLGRQRAATTGRTAPPQPCPTCQGRRWVMKSEAHEHGIGTSSGSLWNEPCPDCAPPAPETNQ